MLFLDFSNGFHDTATVLAMIIATGAMSPAQALTTPVIRPTAGISRQNVIPRIVMQHF
jgi:phosphate/sulfate permease